MEHLDIIIKLGTLLVGFCGIAKWIVHRIEKGQNILSNEHRRDFRALRKELKKRISKEQCRQLRSQCPCKNVEPKREIS